MATDVNAIRNRLASIVVVSTPRASPTTSENILATVGSDDPLFQSTCGTPASTLERSAVQDSTDRWDGNVDGIGSGSHPSSYLLENFLQQALLWKSKKMDSIMMLKEYGIGLYQALVVQIIEFCIRRLLQLRKTMDMQ
jgi:hypothetical protein